MSEVSDQDLQEALTLLNSEKGVEFADQLEKGVHEALSRIHGESDAEIISATPFNQDERERLEEYLTHTFPHPLTFHYRVIPQVLGGFKVSVGDWKLDATLTGQIESMKKTIEG